MSIMVHHFTSKGKSKQYIQIHKKNNLKYQDRTSAPKLNTSFKQSELLFPHPYKHTHTRPPPAISSQSQGQSTTQQAFHCYCDVYIKQQSTDVKNNNKANRL